MLKILFGPKPRSATLPTFSPRSAGDGPPTAAAPLTTNANGSKLLYPLRSVKPTPRRSESLFHSKACTRRPRCRALIFGLTYEALDCRATDYPPLTGCHNDAHGFATLLRENYGWDDITVMTDEEVNRNTKLWPSRDNMMRELGGLVLDACPGDMFVLYYAGHSDQIDALDDGHEIDGKDEYMIPVGGGIIRDDELRDMLVDPLCKGTRLTAVFDSCHSGTMLDLLRYPQLSRRSDEIHVRKTKFEGLAVRANSLPSPSATFWTVSKRVRKYPWGAIKAFARWHFISKYNNRAQGSDATAPPPVALNDAPATVDALTVEVTLGGNTSASDISSFVTDNTPSSIGESPVHHDAETLMDLHSVPGRRNRTMSTTCKDCELLANRPAIVNSISACQDGQQSLEDITRKASIMTPALVEMLRQEPDLSAQQLQRKLQPKLFQACCNFILVTLKNLKCSSNKKRREAQLRRKIARITDNMPWQMLQSGSEEDQHMNEPILVCRPGWKRKDTRK